MKDEATDFLLYSYFGMTQNDLANANTDAKKDEKDEVIAICAQRAYLDLNRTLSFKQGCGEEKRKDFRDKICTVIKEQILTLLGKGDKKEFDGLHQKACKAICKKAEEADVLSKPFWHGQAQKWLNMTIKYMWLLGLWEKQFKRLLPVLHVPVDNKIMEEVWGEHEVELPVNEGKKREGPFSSGKGGKAKAWSQWNCGEYDRFQTSLRKWCKGKAPLEWESSVWMK